MGFGTGFVTGLASSVDRMLQLDINRNMERLSKADDYLLTRYEQQQKREEAEIKKKKEKDALLLQEFGELKQLLGSDRAAVAAVERAGGTQSGLTSQLANLKEQAERGIDLKEYFKVVGDTKGDITIDDDFLLSRYGYIMPKETPATLPESMRGTTGMLSKLGIDVKQDLPEYESLIKEEDRRIRDTSELPFSGQINHKAGYKAMEFSKQMDDKYTSFDEGFTRLQQDIEAAETDEDRMAAEAELDNLILLQQRIEKNKARANGTKPESVFKDPLKAQNVIDKVYTRATKEFSEVDLETGISRALDGTEAQTFGALFDAQDQIRATYTEDGYIDPLLDRLLAQEKIDVQNQVDFYITNKRFDFMEKMRQAPGMTEAQAADATDKFALEPDAATANENMKKGIYKPGTVIQYTDANGNFRVVVWTGTKPLPGKF